MGQIDWAVGWQLLVVEADSRSHYGHLWEGRMHEGNGRRSQWQSLPIVYRCGLQKVYDSQSRFESLGRRVVGSQNSEANYGSGAQCKPLEQARFALHQIVSSVEWIRFEHAHLALYRLGAQNEIADIEWLHSSQDHRAEHYRSRGPLNADVFDSRIDSSESSGICAYGPQARQYRAARLALWYSLGNDSVVDGSNSNSASQIVGRHSWFWLVDDESSPGSDVRQKLGMEGTLLARTVWCLSFALGHCTR